MLFKTNLNKLTLLGNELVKIYFEDKTVEFKIPNLRLLLMDLEFLEFLSLLGQDPKKFNENIQATGFFVETKYEAFLVLIKINYKIDLILKYFKMLYPNSEFKADSIYFQDSQLSNEEYDILTEMLMVCCGYEDIESYLKRINSAEEKIEELSPIQKKMKEQQDKLDRIKAKSQTKKDKSTNQTTEITIDQIVIAVLYEFPGLKLDDILNMNMVTLLDFWKYVSKVVDNQILIVAAGNGLTNNFTYFIN